MRSDTRTITIDAPHSEVFAFLADAALRFADRGGGPAHTWSELIGPLGAEVIAAFEDAGPAVLAEPARARDARRG